MAGIAESREPLVRRNVAVVRHHAQHPEWTYSRIAQEVRAEGYGLPIDAERVGRLIAGWENMRRHNPKLAAEMAGEGGE